MAAGAMAANRVRPAAGAARVLAALELAWTALAAGEPALVHRLTLAATELAADPPSLDWLPQEAAEVRSALLRLHHLLTATERNLRLFDWIARLARDRSYPLDNAPYGGPAKWHHSIPPGPSYRPRSRPTSPLSPR